MKSAIEKPESAIRTKKVVVLQIVIHIVCYIKLKLYQLGCGTVSNNMQLPWYRVNLAPRKTLCQVVAKKVLVLLKTFNFPDYLMITIIPSGMEKEVVLRLIGSK